MSVHSILYRNEWKSCVRYWIDHKNKIYHPRKSNLEVQTDIYSKKRQVCMDSFNLLTTAYS